VTYSVPVIYTLSWYQGQYEGLSFLNSPLKGKEQWQW
jgi:hypothetical protein